MSSSDYELLRTIIQVVGYFGTWILVIGGWIYSSRDNIERERRKELRGQIDTLRTQVEDIEKDAVAYYQAVSATSQAEQLAIKSAVARLSRQLTRLKKSAGLSCVREMIHFRQAVTGGDFESATRQARSATDPVLQNIGHETLNLIDRMESEFSRLYP